MSRYWIAGALAVGALSAPAGAEPAGPPAPSSGVRVEVITGYDDTIFDVTEDSKGLLYGVGLGYDFRLGNKVRFGIEGEAGDSTAKACQSSLFFAGDRLCQVARRDLYAGGRLGMIVGKRNLVYVKGGYSNYRLHSSYVAPAGAPVGSVSGTGNLDGLRLGGGAEIAVGRRTFIKAEYRYSHYETDLDRHQGVLGFGFRF